MALRSFGAGGFFAPKNSDITLKTCLENLSTGTGKGSNFNPLPGFNKRDAQGQDAFKMPLFVSWARMRFSRTENPLEDCPGSIFSDQVVLGYVLFLEDPPVSEDYSKFALCRFACYKEGNMRKIAIALSKGGVAKTTTAVHLAWKLAAEGRKVLLIDTDTQAQCSKLLGVEPSKGLAELLDGEPVDPVEVREGLRFLAGSQRLAQVKRLIAREDIRGEEFLSVRLERFEGQFDFVILDTAPGWDSLSVNVLFYAGEILCPVSMESLAVDGFLSFLENIEQIKRYRDISVSLVLPTFLDGRVKKSRQILEQLQVYFGERVCEPIRYSVNLSRCPAYGQTVFSYAPGDRGAADYSRLARRVLNG